MHESLIMLTWYTSYFPADERERVQKKTFTKWVNSHLQRVGARVNDLYHDLIDGKKLILLLEILSGEKLVSGVLCVYQFQTFCQNGSCQFISCLLIGSTESIHQSHSLFPVLMRRWQHSFVHPAIMFYLLPKRKSQQLAFFVYIWHSGSYSIEKHLSLTACLEKSSNWGSHGKVLEYLNNTYPELLKSI